MYCRLWILDQRVVHLMYTIFLVNSSVHLVVSLESSIHGLCILLGSFDMVKLLYR